MISTPSQLLSEIGKLSAITLLSSIEWLLHNQFLVSDLVDGLWSVRLGSGMGWAHSSAVADSAFLARVGSMLLQPALMQHYGIRGFWRYKDDLLLVADANRVDRLVAIVKARAAPLFEVVLDTINSKVIDFPSIRVFADSEGVVTACPVLRAAAVPLSIASAHPRTCRLRWPTGYMRCSSLLCSSSALSLAHVF